MKKLKDSMDKFAKDRMYKLKLEEKEEYCKVLHDYNNKVSELRESVKNEDKVRLMELLEVVNNLQYIAEIKRYKDGFKDAICSMRFID